VTAICSIEISREHQNNNYGDKIGEVDILSTNTNNMVQLWRTRRA